MEEINIFRKKCWKSWYCSHLLKWLLRPIHTVRERLRQHQYFLDTSNGCVHTDTCVSDFYCDVDLNAQRRGQTAIADLVLHENGPLQLQFLILLQFWHLSKGRNKPRTCWICLKHRLIIKTWSQCKQFWSIPSIQNFYLCSKCDISLNALNDTRHVSHSNVAKDLNVSGFRRNLTV